ncbi:MAG TPA: YajG family lipoprotein [Thermoanaerobaculia bacterium]
MTANSRKVGLWIALSLLIALRAGARESGPLTMALQYTPQESVGSSSAVLSPGMTDRPVRLSMADGRAGDPKTIGEISDHDDKVFPVYASNDVAGWATEVLKKNAADWGIKVTPDAPLSLAGKLTQLRLVASTKALGATYTVEIQVAFTLSDSKGRTLWEGAAKGDATRYGHARSAENANEVLSDAIKEAYANIFNDPGLQSAWLGKSKPVASASTPAATAPAEPPVSPETLLADLVKLKKQGFTTDLLVDYVNGKSLTKALSADDLVKWKNAGMPQEVIKAALGKGKG